MTHDARRHKKFSHWIFSTLAIMLGGISLVLGGIPGQAAADTLSLPSTETGQPGDIVQIVMDVTDATTGFFSADLVVAYDPAILAATGATKRAVANANFCGDLQLNIDNVLGEMSIALLCSESIQGAADIGQLLRINFDVVGGSHGDTSGLTFIDPVTTLAGCRLDEGSVPCTAVDGLFAVVVPFSTSGKVIYYNGLETRPLPADERPVSGVSVDMSGDFTKTDTTDASGAYTHTNLNGLAPNVTVQPTKLGELGSPAEFISAFDASLVARHIAALITLNARQQLAADASGNGSIGTFDATKIAQFAVGTETQFNIGADCDTDFVFIPDSPPPCSDVTNPACLQPSTDANTCVYGEIAYSPLEGDQPLQDFIAILIGDVSGNWAPAGAPPILQPQTAALPERAQLSVGKKIAKPGSTVTLPINIKQAQGVLGVDLMLQYADGVLLPLSVEKTGLTEDMTVVSNVDEPGLVKIALYGTEELRRKKGKLLKVTFEVIGQAGVQSPVTLLQALVNEKAAAVQDGRVRVR